MPIGTVYVLKLKVTDSLSSVFNITFFLKKLLKRHWEMTAYYVNLKNLKWLSYYFHSYRSSWKILSKEGLYHCRSNGMVRRIVFELKIWDTIFCFYHFSDAREQLFQSTWWGWSGFIPKISNKLSFSYGNRLNGYKKINLLSQSLFLKHF